MATCSAAAPWLVACITNTGWKRWLRDRDPLCPQDIVSVLHSRGLAHELQVIVYQVEVSPVSEDLRLVTALNHPAAMRKQIIFFC